MQKELTTKMIEIKLMTSDDVEEIAELDKLCFSVPWSYDAFLSETQNTIARYIVAKDGDHCIGYCGFWIAYDSGDITNVAVHPDYRKQGIGTQLIGAMINLAKSEGVTSMNLEVRKSNVAAQKLYSKYGFKCVGTRKGYYSDNKEDALIMVVNLGE